MPQLLAEILGRLYAPTLIPAFRIGWVLIAGYIILKLIDSALNRLRLLIPSSDVLGVARVEQRTATLRQIIRSVTKAILILVVVLTISSELGFNIGPVLASAGIVGLAVGFGAQSLVKDVISGFFILFEDQFGIGDVVKIGEFTGIVEQMNSIRRELNWRRKLPHLGLRPSRRPLPGGEGRVRVSIFDVFYLSCCFFWAMNSSIPFRLSFLACHSF